jgi:hypothetical protein
MVLGCLARCLFIGLEADPGIRHQVKMTQYMMQEFTINRQIFISRCCFVWCDLVFGGVAIERPDVLMLNVMVERPNCFNFKEIPDEKSRHLEDRDLQFFPLSVFIRKYNLFYVIYLVNTVLYRVKSSSLFVKQAIFYHLHGKELNFNTLSLLPFFRLLVVFFRVESMEAVNCVGKKTSPMRKLCFPKQ